MMFNIIRNPLRLVPCVFLMFLILIVSSCNLTLATSDHLQIVVKGESFTISWDDDSLRVANNVNRTVKYKVYYRPHGSSFWNYIGETEAVSNPDFTIDESLLDYGIYDLGVSSVNGSGVESNIHSSLDMTADPFCGWYVNWIGSK